MNETNNTPDGLREAIDTELHKIISGPETRERMLNNIIIALAPYLVAHKFGPQKTLTHDTSAVKLPDSLEIQHAPMEPMRVIIPPAPTVAGSDAAEACAREIVSDIMDGRNDEVTHRQRNDVSAIIRRHFYSAPAKQPESMLALATYLVCDFAKAPNIACRVEFPRPLEAVIHCEDGKTHTTSGLFAVRLLERSKATMKEGK